MSRTGFFVNRRFRDNACNLAASSTTKCSTVRKAAASKAAGASRNYGVLNGLTNYMELWN